MSARSNRKTARPPKITDRLLHSVARIAGRDPRHFEGCELPSGEVLVRGPRAEALYRGPAWISRLCRHLYQGYFDAPAKPVDAK